MLTTDANALMKPIHERMPVIIPPEQYGLWLNPECQDAEKLEGLLRPFLWRNDRQSSKHFGQQPEKRRGEVH
jgi:putative SOS response-associated peptidase YedK